MKGKEIITHAVRGEMPDMEQLRKNSIRQATEKRTAKHSPWAKRLVPVAVCLGVLLAAVIAFPHFNNNITAPEVPSNETHNNETDSTVDSVMRGLPTENFNLADVENGGAMMSRIGFINFGFLFRYGTDCFAVVKVSDTRTTNEEQQVSDVMILQKIYGACEADTVQITQHIYKNHFCLGTTNLLRKGGLYLLPLSQGENEWYVMGDMDVLFEIDDTGKVWSHSDFEDFNRYDGTSIETLIEELQTMFSDDDFMLANSPFGNVLRNWTLADIAVSEKSGEKIDKDGFAYFSYGFTVNEILSDPDHSYAAPLQETGSIKVYADEADTIKLLPKGRYLICLDRYEGEIYVNAGMIAKIGDDDTITVVPAPDDGTSIGASVFTPYDGLKTADIRDMVLRINTWLKTHGE